MQETVFQNGSLIVFLPCSDIVKTRAFYEGLLGLRVAQIQGNGTAIIFDTGYGYIGFAQYTDGRPLLSGAKGVCISLNCRDRADVDAHFAMVKEKGVKIMQEPMLHKVYPVYSCFIKDPDDYTVEYQKID